MQILKKITVGIASAALFVTSAFASVVQSASVDSYDHYWYQGWSSDLLAQVTFNQNTTSVASLTGSGTAYDQGWGGYAPCCNSTNLYLLNGSTQLWSDHFLGGNRAGADDPNQSYSISAAQLSALNMALQGIDWSATPNVTLQMRADAWAYPGWELHVRNAEFTVASNVPEPASIALLGLGLAGLAAVRRKAAKK